MVEIYQNLVKRRRYKQLNIRLTPEEYQQIKDDAALMSITIGAYMRKIALDAPVPKQSKRPCVEVQTLAKILGHIGKIGSNLNQIAQAANSYVPYDKVQLTNELNALKHVRERLKYSLNHR